MKNITERFINESNSTSIELTIDEMDMLLETFNFSDEIYKNYVQGKAKYGGKDYTHAEYDKLSQKLFDAIDEVSSSRGYRTEPTFTVTFDRHNK